MVLSESKYEDLEPAAVQLMIFKSGNVDILQALELSSNSWRCFGDYIKTDTCV